MTRLLIVLVLWLLTRRLAYGTPSDPVGGTVITVAYAVANILDPIRWLRTMTGGGDPPGSNYWLRSVTTTSVAWVQRTTEVLAAIGYTPLNKAGDAMTGVLSVPPSFGMQLGGPANPGWLYDVADTATVLQAHVDRFLLNDRANTSTMLEVNKASGVFRAFGQTVWHAGNLPATQLVPVGLIAAFPNAASIAAGWNRCDGSGGRPNLNGKMLVGAGTFGGQTFVEGAGAGSSTWAHRHGVGTYAASVTAIEGDVESGTGSTAVPDHGHPFNGESADATWIPPSHTIVWAQKS